MVKYITYCIAALIFITFSLSYNQQGGVVKKNKKDLSKLKEEIKSLELELKSKSQKERESSIAIENYSKQTYIINKLIDGLQEQEAETEQQIEETKNYVDELVTKISELKINYSKYVVSIYKYGKSNEFALLYSSDSFNQAIIRFKYLRMFSQRRSNDLKFLKESKAQLIILKNQLELDKQEKINLAEDKQNEENNYEKKISENKRILSIVKKDKEQMKKLLSSKKAAEVKIKGLIAKSIDEDIRRKQLAEENKKKKENLINKKKEDKALAELTKKKEKSTDNLSKVKNKKEFVVSTKTKNIESKSTNLENEKTAEINYLSGASFSSLKGKLNWPVSGKLFGKYGENRNEQLNTVSLNYGIDILANSDLNVKAVAEGVVSVIDWIVGYGSVVIVTHKGGYRTVYSHLAGIHIKEGDRVKAGSIIGRVGESVEGNLLHFEVWSERNNQNPEIWLAKR